MLGAALTHQGCLSWVEAPPAGESCLIQLCRAPCWACGISEMT